MKQFLRINVFVIVFITIVFTLFYFGVSILHAQSSSNLIQNSGFESNMTGWTQSGGGSIITSPTHSGSRAFRSTGGFIQQTISGLTVGQTYKIAAWVNVISVSGGSWGGARLWVEDTSSWNELACPQYFNEHVVFNTWTKVGCTFKATTSQVRINAGNYGDKSISVVFDDMLFLAKPAVNTPPTGTISCIPTSISSLPGVINCNATVEDVDGYTANVFWEFGDGGRSDAINATHSYAGNGTFSVKMTVVDDDNATYSPSPILVTVADPTYPTLSLNSPSISPYTTSNSVIPFSGTAGGTLITKIDWSSDRGQMGTATGTTTWSFSLDLTGHVGLNQILITATDSTGKIASKIVAVNYQPGTVVSITGGSVGVLQNLSNVELYDKFEASFQLQNGGYTNPYFPYEVNLPGGMQNGIGVTVEGIFKSPSGATYTQPGFWYQPYVRDTTAQNLIPSGSAMWKIRFAPLEIGNWTYQIKTMDLTGTSTLTDAAKLKFTAVSPTNSNNHGFIKVSSKDSRYFEFSDGTAFNSYGTGPFINGLNSFATDTNISNVGDNSANFSRVWMSGSNIAGSSWGAWAAGLGYDGNPPRASLTSDETYGNGKFTLTLPQKADGARCNFWGWDIVSPKISVKTNTNYQVMVRLKTVGIIGTGGVTFRPLLSDWPDNCDKFAGNPLIIPYTKGTTDWHIVTGSFNSGSSNNLGTPLLTLENVTSGQAYIDEVSIRENLGGGNLGPEILPRSKFNLQDYFTQTQSWNWDYSLDQFAQKGMYVKPVIEEKQDYLFNHISNYGLGTSMGADMENIGGASNKYQEYYWRYLISRFGYSRAIHSWEYVNEESPGNLGMTNTMAGYFLAHDPARHLGTTSFWSSISNGTYNFWADPAYPNIGYADAHSYVNAPPDNSSWLNGAMPFTFHNTTINNYAQLGQDTALYVMAHSIDAWNKKASGDKPIVMGEAGMGYNNVIAGNNDTDTKGVWLHQMIWSQLNPGGMYFLPWYNDTAYSNNLYKKEGFYLTYRRFMDGASSDAINKRIPINNGNYIDINPNLPTGIWGWGQKDTVNGGAHVWIYDQNYNWTNTGGGGSVGGKTISFGGLPAKSYEIDWWDTWTGVIVTQTLNHPGGTMTLTVPVSITNRDAAVKVIPVEGYIGVAPIPLKTGDANGDNKVNSIDFTIWLKYNGTNVSGGNTVGDFNTDGHTDINDFSIWISHYGT